MVRPLCGVREGMLRTEVRRLQQALEVYRDGKADDCPCQHRRYRQDPLSGANTRNDILAR